MFNSKQLNTQYVEIQCGRCGHRKLISAKKARAGFACGEVAPAHWPSASGLCEGLRTVIRVESKTERLARFNRMCEVRVGSETYLSQ